MADTYQIRVEGQLDEGWDLWFDGMTISNMANGTALLSGEIEDQAALHGLIVKIRDLGLPLIEVRRLGTHGQENDM